MSTCKWRFVVTDAEAKIHLFKLTAFKSGKAIQKGKELARNKNIKIVAYECVPLRK